MEQWLKRKIAAIVSPAIGMIVLIVLILGMVSAAADWTYDHTIGAFKTSVSGELLDTDAATFTEQAAWQLVEEANELYREQMIEAVTAYEAEIEEKYVNLSGDLYYRDKLPEEYVIEKYLYNIDYAYAYAWMTLYTDMFNDSSGYISLTVDDILKFYNQITRVTTMGDYTEGVFRICNNVLSLDAIARSLYPSDPMMQEMFVDDYELYTDLFSFYGIGYGSYNIYEDYSGERTDYSSDAILYTSEMNVPVFYQTDYRNVPYGTGTISSCGCAPTCIAMILSYLTGSSITPIDVIGFTGNRYYVAGQGSSGEIFPACAAQWGFHFQNLAHDSAAAIRAVQNGYPVIVSVGAGYFTSGGHFMVITGVTEDGYFIINDPNGANVRKYGTNRFSIDLVLKDAVNFRYFY